MKILPVLLCLPWFVSLSSCDIYVRDAIHGSPYQESYGMNYENAKAEGLSAEEAHRRALLVGSEKSRQRWDKRKKKQEEQPDRHWWWN